MGMRDSAASAARNVVQHHGHAEPLTPAIVSAGFILKVEACRSLRLRLQL